MRAMKALDAPRDKPKRGAPTKFDPKFIAIAKSMCLLGAIDAEIADAFGVSTSTFWAWKVKYVELEEACRVGKGVFDARVVRSLAQNATGFSVDVEEVKVHFAKKVMVEIVQDEDGNEKEVEVDLGVKPVEHRVKVRKYFQPDTTAQIFWLKNRMPEQFRDRHELTGNNGAPLEGPGMNYLALLGGVVEGMRRRMLATAPPMKVIRDERR